MTERPRSADDFETIRKRAEELKTEPAESDVTAFARALTDGMPEADAIGAIYGIQRRIMDDGRAPGIAGLPMETDIEYRSRIEASLAGKRELKTEPAPQQLVEVSITIPGVRNDPDLDLPQALCQRGWPVPTFDALGMAELKLTGATAAHAKECEADVYAAIERAKQQQQRADRIVGLPSALHPLSPKIMELARDNAIVASVLNAHQAGVLSTEQFWPVLVEHLVTANAGMMKELCDAVARSPKPLLTLRCKHAEPGKPPKCLGSGETCACLANVSRAAAVFIKG